LGAATGTAWRDWRRAAKKNHAVRYWIAEEGLDYLQNFTYYIPDKIYALKYYINNRFVTRTHALTAHASDIPRGEWRDLGDRFLPCMFNELVNYVEVELAWWHIAWSDRAERAKYHAPFWATGWFRWRAWRCRQAGLDNLDWQSKLTWTADECEPGSPNIGKATPQAESAKEILQLYYWWTVYRPMRRDPHDASGWSAYCDERRLARKDTDDDFLSDLDREKTPEEHARVDAMLKLTNELEAKYETEDTDMMIRLIKIRRSLWT
jgi:hypothetical protein